MYKKYCSDLASQSAGSSGKSNTQEKMSDLEDLWKKLQGESKSLLKKHLTEKVYNETKGRKTKLGGTLADCIRSGALNLNSGVGLYACDPEAYETFKELFDPVICDYHKVDKVAHPKCDFGPQDNLGFDPLDPTGEFIVSTRVRVGRSHDGYPFPPVSTDEQRKDMEEKTKAALDKLEGELKGKYYSLETMTPEENQQLIDDHFMFKNDDKMLGDAGGYNGWPKARGIFFNEKKTFLVWINEEDHLRFISMQKGGDVGEVYRRLVSAIKSLEKNLKFAYSDRHGYLTFCPTNLGTTLRASVHIKVPKLAKNEEVLKKICEDNKLQPRGIHGEHTESVGGVYDISNKRRLGLTEFQAMQEMYNGIKQIIEADIIITWMSLEELWNKLKNATDCKSLLKKHLTPEIYEQLKDKKTKFGGTLLHCIQSGCKNLDSGCGIYASDPEAYDVFKEVLFPVIQDYHKVSEVKHPQPDFGDLNNLGFGDLDPSGEYIVSTRVRVGRSHASFGFPPVCNAEQRKEMEKISVDALNTLGGELKGKYYSLETMTPEENQQLIDDHFMFKNDDRFLQDAGGYNDWPIGRGIFFNDNKTFLCWVNEEDHLRLISMQKGGDLAAVYKRLITAIKEMEKKLTFAHHNQLGYLTFCPTNLGTTCRASVHIKIPKLSAEPDFKAFCEKLNLQPRGIHGEHTESVGGVYDISNKRRLGLSEIEAIQEMRRGVEEIIKREKELQGK
ncbi:taurocyamine kinase-like [Saccostrea cucullata]|uniref:taurocyamine kinase-like n=1 Tax=Saccostrea cuccullata TaxID=36930 RepID=UPI002ED353B9